MATFDEIVIIDALANEIFANSRGGQRLCNVHAYAQERKAVNLYRLFVLETQ